MSFIIVTYLGIGVGILILLWAIVVLTARYFLRGRRKRKVPNIWVRFKPIPIDPLDNASPLSGADSEGQLRRDLRTRAQQNGHYMKSNKNP